MSAAPTGTPSHGVTNPLRMILGVAAAMRLASIFLVRNYRHPQTWEFGEQAIELFRGHGYTKVLENGLRVPSAHMPPLYPWVLVWTWRLFGLRSAGYIALELAQALLGVLLVLTVYKLGCLLASDKAALSAAALVAVWPSFVYLCNEFHSISIYILLGTASVFYLTRFIEKTQDWNDALCLGLCVGGLLFNRAEAVVLLGGYAFLMLWRCGRAATLKTGAMCLLSLAMIAPWTARNYHVFGRLVLVSTSGGFNLWVGHNRCAMGNSDYSFICLEPWQQKLMRQDSGGIDSELVANRLYKQFALQHMRDYHSAELRLAARKLLFFCLFDPTHQKARQLAYWLPSLTLTFLSGWGMWLRRGKRWNADLPLLFTVALSIMLSVAVFSLPRYRIAIDPLLAIYAGRALVAIYSAALPAGRSLVSVLAGRHSISGSPKWRIRS